MKTNDGDKNWWKFWNSPHIYMDSTWRPLITLKSLASTRSHFKWQSCYPYICEKLDLEVKIQYPKHPLWASTLCTITQHPKRSITMAGIAYSLDNFNYIEKSEKNNLILEDYKVASQLGGALALKSRFNLPESASTCQHKGLWLLNQALALDFPIAWQRIRLAFDKKQINLYSPVSNFDNKINTATLRRLWHAIAHKLNYSEERK